MIRQYQQRGYRARWLGVALTLLGLSVLLGSGTTPSLDLQAELDQLSAAQAFNFFSWEIDALLQKVLYGLLSPQRFLDDEQQSRFVLAYLEDVGEANRLSDEIDRIYTDPEIVDPETASYEEQRAFARLRRSMAQRAPITEAILQAQVSLILADGGAGVLASILPPVTGTFTPLPAILVVSPRGTIESTYQQQLVAGLTAAEQAEIEDRVIDAQPDYASYVTEIGGLAAYPAMLLETSSIDWVTDVFAHEWVHHYLTFFPLGWNYMRFGETRTINETTASLIGDWAGQEILLRFYEPLFVASKELPEALVATPPAEGDMGQVFDFRAEMHHTRVTVDRMLAEGQITEAEWYMEAQRRYFVANGYRIRKLNQAYFAFHGAYASTPGGAAGEDPIGPLVRQYWALSKTPAEFLQSIAPVVTVDDLKLLLGGDDAMALGPVWSLLS
jgi:hypothetical protein